MRRKKFDVMTIVGLIGTIVLHGGLVGIVVYRQSLQAIAAPPPGESYVVAKLVRLGKPRDKKLLPQKIVPQEATRKDEGVDLSQDMDAKPQEKPKQKKEEKISDRIQQALNRNELMAEAQQQIEAEGSPDGVESGTADSAEEGDAYISRIADIWNRTWSLPSIIPADQAKGLYVLVVVKIDAGGNIQFPITIDRPSGNKNFDNSIIAAWQKIEKLPLPPQERLATVMTNGLALRLTWRGMQ